jgi:hypothetical protein
MVELVDMAVSKQISFPIQANRPASSLSMGSGLYFLSTSLVLLHRDRDETAETVGRFPQGGNQQGQRLRLLSDTRGALVCVSSSSR